MRRTIVVLMLLLAGCDRWKPARPEVEAPTQAQTTATQASDFSKPILARGNEPFWSLKIDGTAFTLSRPGQADVLFTAPGAMIVPNKANWTAKAADGRTLVVTLFVSDCSDGMSDMAYPMTAEVTLGSDTFRGCAAKASEMPKEAGAGG
jgi:uncharacterized membrane protein